MRLSLICRFRSVEIMRPSRATRKHLQMIRLMVLLRRLIQVGISCARCQRIQDPFYHSLIYQGNTVATTNWIQVSADIKSIHPSSVYLGHAIYYEGWIRVSVDDVFCRSFLYLRYMISTMHWIQYENNEIRRFIGGLDTFYDLPFSGNSIKGGIAGDESTGNSTPKYRGLGDVRFS